MATLHIKTLRDNVAVTILGEADELLAVIVYSDEETRDLAFKVLAAANEAYANKICWCGHTFGVHNTEFGSGGCELCGPEDYKHNPSKEKPLLRA